MSLEDLFCDVDEFCQVFLPAWHRQLLTEGTRQRRRASRLTLSEIMMILIYFASIAVPQLQGLLSVASVSALRGRPFHNRTTSDNWFVALIVPPP
jgi:hypothetical protein